MADRTKRPLPQPQPNKDLTPSHGGRPANPTTPGNNPRLQAAPRWQRTKRYGWDSR